MTKAHFPFFWKTALGNSKRTNESPLTILLMLVRDRETTVQVLCFHLMLNKELKNYFITIFFINVTKFS